MDPGAHRPEPAPNPELALTASRVGATGFRTLAADAGRVRPPPPAREEIARQAYTPSR